MKISVVTVAYNAGTTIEQTILSVSAQSYSDREHIIIDGCSTDDTTSVISRHRDKIDVIVSEPDNGLYDAMNKGMAMATGEIVGFLNADDFYAHDQVLQRVSEQFSRSEIQACYADLVYLDKDDLSKVVRYWTSTAYRDGLFEKGWMPAHPTFYVKRSVYQKWGGFDLRYRFQSDYELTARLLAVKKIPVQYVPEVWVKMRTGGTTNRSAKNILLGNIESYKACKRLGLKMTPWYFVTKFAMRIPQFFKSPMTEQ